MNRTDQRFMQIAENEAIANGVYAGARIGSVLVYKNQQVVVGYNHPKSNPFYAKYGKNEDAIFAHAETHAIHKAMRILNPDNFRKVTLYVCRIKFVVNGDRTPYWGLAKPCSGCMEAIKMIGIRRVVFSLNQFSENGDMHDHISNREVGELMFS